MGFWDNLESTALVPYRTVSGLFRQASVIPNVVYSAVAREDIRRIPLMTGHIVGEDIIKVMLIAWAWQQVQSLTQEYLDEAPADVGWFSVYTALQVGMLMVSGLIWAYTEVRKPLQKFTRSQILEVEASNTLIDLGDRGCGLIRLSDNPETMPVEQLKKMLGKKPAYAIHAHLAWYIDRQARLTRLDVPNFHDFRKIFPKATDTNQFTVAKRRHLDSISVLTGRTHHNLPMTLCEEEHCGVSKFVLGGLRSRTTLPVTSVSISLLGLIARVGCYVANGLLLPPYATGGFLALWYVSEGLKIVLNGRYIQQSTMPELCADHQMIYLTEYFERSLSFGLSHWALSEVVIRTIEQTTGLPRQRYESTVREYMLMFNISVAAHVPQAQAVTTTQRYPDPVAMLQGMNDIIFEIARVGAGKVLPPIFKDRPQGTSLAEWLVRARTAWEHPVARYVEFIFVPRLLRSKRAFTTDPVIAPSWEAVRQMVIKVLEVIDVIHKRLDVKMATYAPGSAALLAKQAFGLPEPLVNQLLILLGNSDAMEAARSLRRHLFAMIPGDGSPLELTIDPDMLPLRAPGEPTHPADLADSGIPSRNSLSAQTVILPQTVSAGLLPGIHGKDEPASSPASDGPVLSRGGQLTFFPQNKPEKQRTAADIIRPSGPGAGKSKLEDGTRKKIPASLIINSIFSTPTAPSGSTARQRPGAMDIIQSSRKAFADQSGENKTRLPK